MSEPDFISSGLPHQVVMLEGSKIAGGKKAGPVEHSVRNTLAGEDQAPVEEAEPEFTPTARLAAATPEATLHVPPPVRTVAEPTTLPLPPELASATGQTVSDAPVIERSLKDAVAELPQPAPASPAGGEEAPLLSREQSDTWATLPSTLGTDHAEMEGLQALRREDEVMALVPEAAASGQTLVKLPESAPVSPPAAGPLVRRDETESMALLPESGAAGPLGTGPLVTRDESQILAELPELAAGLKSAPEIPPPSASLAELEVPPAVPAFTAFRQPVENVEPVERVLHAEQAEEAEQVELAQASPQAEPSPPSATSTAESGSGLVLEHVMADQEFPARLIKLKIANDNVRVRLDALEKPERPIR